MIVDQLPRKNPNRYITLRLHFIGFTGHTLKQKLDTDVVMMEWFTMNDGYCIGAKKLLASLICHLTF